MLSRPRRRPSRVQDCLGELPSSDLERVRLGSNCAALCDDQLLCGSRVHEWLSSAVAAAPAASRGEAFEAFGRATIGNRRDGHRSCTAWSRGRRRPCSGRWESELKTQLSTVATTGEVVPICREPSLPRSKDLAAPAPPSGDLECCRTTQLAQRYADLRAFVT